MTVGELLGILRITKQSLNRVLGQLVRQGFIVQHRGPARPPAAPAGTDRKRPRAGAASCRSRSAPGSPPPIARPAPRRSRGSARCCSASSPDEDDRRRFDRRASRRSVDARNCRIIPGAMSGSRATEPHLLVVDDDARLRELLRRYLSDNGFRVTPPRMPPRRAPASRALPSICRARRDDAGRERARADPRAARATQCRVSRSCC